MNLYEKALLAGFIASYLPAFGLFHLMIFRVNRELPSNRRIPHHLYFGEWERLAKEHKRLYPSSFLYQIALACAVASLTVAVVFAGFRIWEYLARG